MLLRLRLQPRCTGEYGCRYNQAKASRYFNRKTTTLVYFLTGVIRFLPARSNIIEFLKKSPLFSPLSANTLADVADRMELEHHAAGSVILRQGDPGDKLYVIRSGKAEVEVTERGATRHIAALKEGDYFGEAALVSGEPRNATVRAVGDAELYTLGKEDFDHVIDSSPPFRDELRRVLFGRQ